ncbi:hypothetical protein ACWEVD_02875 [Nocardia thailandica]
MEPSTEVTLEVQPFFFDDLAERRLRRLAFALPLPPVCAPHGERAARWKPVELRFWGEPGDFRQQGVGRSLWEEFKKQFIVDSGPITPDAMIRSQWPMCPRCASADRAAEIRRRWSLVGLVLPLIVGLLSLPTGSMWALILCAVGLLVLAVGGFAGVVLGNAERVVTGRLSGDARSFTFRAHPAFAAAARPPAPGQADPGLWAGPGRWGEPGGWAGPGPWVGP